MGWVKTGEKNSGEKSGEKTEVRSWRDVSRGLDNNQQLRTPVVITGSSQGWAGGGCHTLQDKPLCDYNNIICLI